ncbi:sugar efflux transporter [Lentzea sp. NBRC 105346]|uniref:sugar efflux transporter n=1 Tax=Lentzea sp. NBRC 105346 TaxID=3032205 RepID=UPI00255631C2|nr:sugar efflux transporter [Lentzea sp. NBRC 105346]
MTLTRENPFRTRSVLQLAVISVVIGVSTAFALPFGSLFLTREVGVSPLALGTFMFLSPVASVVASTIIGKLSDTRVQRRRVMILGGLAGLLGYALFAVLRDYWILLAASVTFVAIASSLLPQLFAYGRQLAGESMVVSVLRTLISVAWVAGPPLAALIVSLAGFTGLYVVTALLYALVAGLAATLPDVERAPTLSNEGGGGMLLAATSFTFLQGSTALAVSGLPLFVIEVLRGTEGEAGLVLGLCAALEIPMMLGLGMLARRGDLHRIVLAGGAIAVTYHVTMLLTQNIWHVAALQLLHAAGISAIMGVGISYFQSLAPDRPGHATTVFTNSATAGGMIAGPLLGVAQVLGFRSTYAISFGMCLLGLVLLVVVGVTRRSRPRP